MTNEQIQAFVKEFNDLFAKHSMMPSDLLNAANRYDTAPVIGAITGTLTTALAAYMVVIDCTVNVEYCELRDPPWHSGASIQYSIQSSLRHCWWQ